MECGRNKPKEAPFLWKICVEFPSVSVVKNLSANTGGAGDMGSIPGSGRSPGEENGNPLQYSCLEKPHGQRSLAATVHEVAKKIWTQLSD